MEFKEFMIIGCGRFGRSVAVTLAELGHEVLVIDKDEDTINEISTSVTHAVSADVMIEGTLESLGIHNMDEVIVAMGSNFEASLMATAVAKENNVKTVIAKVSDKIHGRIMKKVGADRVIIPEKDSGIRLAYNISTSNILDYIEVSDDFSIMEVKPPKSWIGRSLAQLDIRNNYGVTVVAVKEEDVKEININPKPDYVFDQSDIVLVLGKYKKIEEIVGEES
ncbi:MAG: TrkA family potassium uptake protein [Gallicola sp.]|uniref:potassium channel family protein n=1 Tax=Gallicola sp. Sow4_E12 TaxID=3438785 RepID=UPI0017D2B49C|nr:TrkA family potassium uptake protein [Gallicola sp.]